MWFSVSKFGIQVPYKIIIVKYCVDFKTNAGLNLHCLHVKCTSSSSHRSLAAFVEMQLILSVSRA